MKNQLNQAINKKTQIGREKEIILFFSLLFFFFYFFLAGVRFFLRKASIRFFS
jgi:hypothetical protein